MAKSHAERLREIANFIWSQPSWGKELCDIADDLERREPVQAVEAGRFGTDLATELLIRADERRYCAEIADSCEMDRETCETIRDGILERQDGAYVKQTDEVAWQQFKSVGTIPAQPEASEQEPRDTSAILDDVLVHELETEEARIAKQWRPLPAESRAEPELPEFVRESLWKIEDSEVAAEAAERLRPLFRFPHDPPQIGDECLIVEKYGVWDWSKIQIELKEAKASRAELLRLLAEGFERRKKRMFFGKWMEKVGKILDTREARAAIAAAKERA